MRVFVLGTGRCGTHTFSAACEHMTNYTSAHESRAGSCSKNRLDFPDQHIEADHHLIWFHAELERRYGKEPFYVHLLRDPEKVAQSFNTRWGRRDSVIEAFGYGLLQRDRLWSVEDRLEVCRLYVQTVTENVEDFLRDKPHQLTLHLESIQQGFREFWSAIGAEGDQNAALAEFHQAHDKTSPFRRRYQPAIQALRSIRRTIF